MIFQSIYYKSFVSILKFTRGSPYFQDRFLAYSRPPGKLPRAGK
jgi:hypothetical protein